MTGDRKATVAYVAPFAAFVGSMGIERALGVPPLVAYPIRLLAVSAVILFCSRKVIPLRPSFPVASIAIGLAVFLVWIAPDVLFGPKYRAFWTFENAFTGVAATSIPIAVQQSLFFLVLRVASSILLVPVAEELFWRGWLMRWLIHTEFPKVSIGTYTAASFWAVAVLFAAEHGPYWDVGLLAGVIYNAWAVRSRSLADCILAHAVTNGALAAYVILRGQWQYWL